ncbi:energy transducer TonB [Pseudoduganella sp. GCM10020061]|uniref:energy transducer TonB n=1 Tax=Pseudoduganella sp. GCM10020061 TaxID=3317345 RepID=UPI00363A7D6D
MKLNRLFLPLAALAAFAYANSDDLVARHPPPMQGELAGGIPRNCAGPAYPAEARRYELEGKTVIELLIGEDGRVHDKRVLASSGWALLDDATLGAMSACRFTPMTRDGKLAGATWKKMAFSWALEDGGNTPGTRPEIVPESCAAAGRLVLTEGPAGGQGVLLRFLITPAGTAFGIKAERGSHDDAARAEAVRAVESCKFTPSLYRGLPGPGHAFARYQPA